MPKKIMLLGSGELGKEFVIAAQRLGQHIIAVDSYNDAPAQQVADEREVINMLDGAELDRIVAKHQPDIIVPEIEAIRTERFYDYERQGIHVVPSAKAANFTMNRKAIRDLAAKELGLRTASYRYAGSLAELQEAIKTIGIPCVVKPLMSSSASAVILADKEGSKPVFTGVETVLSQPKADIRLFGKPTTRPYRRMGVVLTYDQPGTDIDAIKQRAIDLAKQVTVTPTA
jgi:formate-dependent phosphoribosylglycinamide formyltransferase (GAR transformylase)